jgi:hypothetical protein
MEATTIHLDRAQCRTSGMGIRTICPKCDLRVRWLECGDTYGRPWLRCTSRFASTWRIAVLQAAVRGAYRPDSQR